MITLRAPGRHEPWATKGQSTVEFALGLSLLVTLTLGVAQVALVATAQVIAVQIAGEVARVVSIDPAADPLRVAAAVAPIAAERLQVEVERVDTSEAEGDLVEVRVVIDVPSLVPFVESMPVEWRSTALAP